MKKVYCGNCKYVSGAEHYAFLCLRKGWKVVDTPSESYKTWITLDCEVENKNNDCSHYERKWWLFLIH